jgi:ribokinase
MIVVFGSINLDLVAQVERMPKPGETFVGDDFAALPGGKGANQALAARRAGSNVAMYGAVGGDAWGDLALAGLTAAGVDITGVARVAVATGVALIHVARDGENCITVVPGANAFTRAAAVPDDVLDADSVVIVQLEVPLAEVELIAARASARGASVILNAAPARAVDAGVLRRVHALVVNEHEAATLAEGWRVPAQPDAFARELHAAYNCAVVVTLGSRGALAVAEGEMFALASPRVAVVDTTGAGDAFVGALAAAVDRRAQWRRALAEAVSAGSLACGTKGAQPAIPAREAIQALADTVESKLPQFNEGTLPC